MKRLVRRKRKVPSYTVRGCPLTKSNTLWCHGLCTPKDGVGLCGRVYPHTIEGKTQQALLKYMRKHGQEV